MKKEESWELSQALAPNTGPNSVNDKEPTAKSPVRRCRSGETEDASAVKRCKQEQKEADQEETSRGRSKERVPVRNVEPPGDVSLMGWEVKSNILPKRR